MKKILAILVVLMLSLLPVGVMAATITVTNQPVFTAGIYTFTVTYISDTEMDLAWTIGTGVDKVMVRAKYGSYPADIPDEYTSPSDGYLVYYGTD